MWNKFGQAAIIFRKTFSKFVRKYTDDAAKKVTHAKPMIKDALVLSSGLCAALLLTDLWVKNVHQFVIIFNVRSDDTSIISKRTGKFLSTPKIKLTVSDRLVDAINRKVDLNNFDSCEGKLSGHLKYCRGDEDPKHGKQLYISKVKSENEHIYQFWIICSAGEIEEEFDVEISFKVSKMDKDGISDECKWKFTFWCSNWTTTFEV